MNQAIELVKMQFAELTPIAAMFPEAITIEEWAQAGRQLSQLGACVQWWLGDWLVAGDAFRTRNGLGKFIASPAYDVLFEALPFERETLQNMAAISRAVQLKVRTPALSWSHHREVAALEIKEQRRWLAEAEKGKWTVSQLRCGIRDARREHSLDRPAPGLLKWMKPAHDLFRFIRQEENEKPVEQWPKARREAWKKELRPLHEFYEKL